MVSERHTLCKCGSVFVSNLVDKLFVGGSSTSMSAFPVSGGYMLDDRTEGDPEVQMMVSVSKRHFKRAVKRNRVKRQLREAYRRNKQVLHMSPWPDGTKLVMAFIWLDDNMHDSALVEARMKNLLERMTEKLCSRTE